MEDNIQTPKVFLSQIGPYNIKCHFKQCLNQANFHPFVNSFCYFRGQFGRLVSSFNRISFHPYKDLQEFLLRSVRRTGVTEIFDIISFFYGSDINISSLHIQLNILSSNFAYGGDLSKYM